MNKTERHCISLDKPFDHDYKKSLNTLLIRNTVGISVLGGIVEMAHESI